MKRLYELTLTIPFYVILIVISSDVYPQIQPLIIESRDGIEKKAAVIKSDEKSEEFINIFPTSNRKTYQVIEMNGAVDFKPMDISPSYKRLSKQDSDTIDKLVIEKYGAIDKPSKQDLVNDFEISFVYYNSESKESFNTVAKAFGINGNFSQSKSYTLISITKTIPKFYPRVNRNVKLTWGVGAYALVEIEKDAKVGDFSALNLLAANVQLDKVKANIKYKPFGIQGDKIMAKFSEIAGAFDVKGIGNLYAVLDRLQSNFNDSSVSVNPVVIKGGLMSKDEEKWYLSNFIN